MNIVSFDDVLSAPITFNTALPVADGEFIFREVYVISESGDDSGNMNRENTKQSAISVLGYGVNNKLAVFAAVPYIHNDIGSNVSGQKESRSANGLGDLILFGRYTVYQDDRPGHTFRVAPFTGIKIATGEDDKSDSSGRLPANAQPGSGAWDGFAGLIATYQTLNYQIDVQANYRRNGKSNGIENGDELRFDGSLQYRLLPKYLNGGTPGFLYSVLELGFISKGKNRIGGINDLNSGGETLYITPGFQYVSKRWIVESGVQIPAIQNLNGTALENDYIVQVGFRSNF